MTCEVSGRIARITLNRPSRGNGITLDMPRGLAACVEGADLAPSVHVIALSGNGSGFCGGHDLVDSAGRIARMPVNPLMMMKLLLNQSVMQQGLHTTQLLGTVFDGITRHAEEGFAFQHRAAEAGFRQAVRERDEPVGDFGRSPRKD